MIAPTKPYDAFPAMISTRVGRMVSLAYAVSPKLVDRAFNVGVRLLPESSDHGGSDQASGSVHGWALAQLVQAVHW